MRARERLVVAERETAKETRCPFRNSSASSFDLALIRSGRVEEAFKLLGPWTKPRAPVPLLTACLTKWSTTHQGCPGIGPTVRMGMPTVIVFDKRTEPSPEIRHRAKTAALQEPPFEDAKPQFHLIEPGAMRRSEVEHMHVGRISQKGFPLAACFQVSRNEGDVAQLGHDTTDLQAPMSVQVVQHPIKSFDLREPPGDVSQVSGEVHTGATRAQVADDFTGRYDERGDESACPVSDVVLLPSRGFAGLSRLRGMGTTQCLHPRLFITADHQSTLLVHHGCFDIQLANRLSLGVEVRVVAVEPIDAAMRLEVGLVESPPDRGPTHGRSMSALVDQGGSEVIERPTGGRATSLF